MGFFGKKGKVFFTVMALVFPACSPLPTEDANKLQEKANENDCHITHMRVERSKSRKLVDYEAECEKRR